MEAGVKYAQNNAVKGRTFESLTAQNAYLADWEKNVADTRIHGTTRRQVGQLFEEVERPALQPLTGTWAEAMHQTRGPQSLRVMQGLLQLAEKHPADALEKAARIATHHGTWRLRDLKRLLALPGNVVPRDFLESHPLIRSLDAFGIYSVEKSTAFTTMDQTETFFHRPMSSLVS